MAASATSGIMAWVFGAGVVAAVGAGAVYYSGILTPDPKTPVPVQAAQPATGTETPVAAAPEPAGQDADSAPQNTGAADPLPEDIAAVEPEPELSASQAETETTAETPRSAPDLLAPRFDVVRVDPQGNTVIAGTGTPGARVTIFLDGEEQVSAVVDRSGAFVSLLSVPPSGDARILTMIADLDGAQKAADDQIILAPTPGAIPEPEPQIAQAGTETSEPAEIATEQPATEQPAEVSEIEIAEAETDPVARAQPPTSESPATESPTATSTETPAATQTVQDPATQSADRQTDPVVAQTDDDTIADPQQQDAGQGAAEIQSETLAQPVDTAPDANVATENASTQPGNPAASDTAEQLAEKAQKEDAETATDSTVKAAADVTSEPGAEVVAEAIPEEAPPGSVGRPEPLVETETEPTAPTGTEPVVETATATTKEPVAEVATEANVEPVTETITEAPKVAPKVAPTQAPAKALAETEAVPSGAPAGVSEEATEPPVQIAAEATTPDTQEPTVEAATETTTEPAAETIATTATEPTTETTTDPVPAPVTVLRVSPDGIEVLQSGSPVPDVMDQIALDTISYSQAGEVQLSGRAQIQTVIRVYLDNKPVGDLVTDPTGRWSGDVEDIEPGIYTLRLDELGEGGQVLSRIETPFKREAPEVLRPTLDAAVATDGTSDGGPVQAPTIRAVTVQRGDTLWAISNTHYGHGIHYVRVHNANRNDIRDPDLIYPGQVFTIPE